MSSPFLTTCQPWKLGFELENCITRPLSLSLCFRIARAKCSAKSEEKRRSGRRRGAGGKLCETVRRFPPRRRTLKNSGLLCEKERISPSQINFVHRLFTSPQLSIYRRKVRNLQADLETGQTVARRPSFQL